MVKNVFGIPVAARFLKKVKRKGYCNRVLKLRVWKASPLRFIELAGKIIQNGNELARQNGSVPR